MSQQPVAQQKKREIPDAALFAAFVVLPLVGGLFLYYMLGRRAYRAWQKRQEGGTLEERQLALGEMPPPRPDIEEAEAEDKEGNKIFSFISRRR